MALEDPLHRIDTVNLEVEKPVIPWQLRDFDGTVIRNEHERALGDRDVLLLDLLRAVKNHGSANVSPIYPFAEGVTLKPSQATAYDLTDAEMTDFVVDPTPLTLSKDFIGDLKLILTNEFREPFISRMILDRAIDPVTGMVQVFVNLEISARYIGDQQIHPIMWLVNKAFNDVQDNTAPSSRDRLAMPLDSVKVANREWLNSGVMRFNFIGSVQSTLPTSWSVGTYNGTAQVEGFSSLSNLKRIEFTFTRTATSLTELAYNLLGDLRDAVPFLDKIQLYPFEATATAGEILIKYIKEIEIAGPSKPVFLKRIHKVGSDYKFLFAYNDRDLNGNYLGTINIGLATLTPTSPARVPIRSLGSNRAAGVDPTWLDEVQTTGTVDNYGIGFVSVFSYASMADLFAELLATPISVGSPSPIDVSPVVPENIVGLYADPNYIEMVEDNARLDNLVVDLQGTLVTIYDRPLGPQHLTPNRQITIGGVLVNRRTCYGSDAIMRDFYGIPSTETLIDNPKIPLEDEWYDTATNTLKRYQFIQGKRRWRTL